MDMTLTSGKYSAVNVDLTGSTFRDVRLRDAIFDDVDLSGVTFHNANLRNARFNDVNLSGVAIANTNVEGMTIDGILVTELLAAYRRST